MKITVQSKIAELESRIAALERGRVVTTTTTKTSSVVDLEPEMSSIWKSFDALFKKAFRHDI